MAFADLQEAHVADFIGADPESNARAAQQALPRAPLSKAGPSAAQAPP
jgi:hypothetical protein